MPAAIAAVRAAFRDLSLKKAVVPVRTQLECGNSATTALIMPVYLPDTGKLAVKLITLAPNNPVRGLPFSHSLLLVADAVDGRPLAVMEGAWLTAMRTGAASGVATHLLARENADTVAIFGAGLQGRTQLEAVCAVRPIRRAIVFDPDPGKAAVYAAEMSGKLNIAVEPARSGEELSQADIVCTATTSAQPVFRDNRLKAGAHINAVGAYKPDAREIPTETVQRAKVVVDHRESALQEAGDLLIPIREGKFSPEQIYGEIGEIVAGKLAGRESDDEITLFKSVGNAVQDLAVAALVLEQGARRNLGTKLPF